MENKTKIRPTGWFGKLYDIISNKGNPINEIKKVAQQALSDKVIDERMYTILQYRIPFSGFERETLEQLAIRLGVTKDRPRQLEFNIYLRLKKYFYKN